MSLEAHFDFRYTVRLWGFGLYARESIANAGIGDSFGIVQLSGKPGEKRKYYKISRKELEARTPPHPPLGGFPPAPDPPLRVRLAGTQQGHVREDGSLLASSPEMGHQLLPVHAHSYTRSRGLPAPHFNYCPPQAQDGGTSACLRCPLPEPSSGPP